MKFFHNNLNNDQPKTLSKRFDKKSVNIKWNSKLFFQIGLLISLSAVYLIMQTKFEVTEKHFAKIDLDYLDEIPLITFTVEEPILAPKKKPIVKVIPPKVIEKVIEVVPDETPDKKISKTEVPVESNKNTTSSPKKEDKSITLRSLMGVEFVPVFPGCELSITNEDKRNCMSKKIRKFIVRKFNTNKLDDIDLVKSQKIVVQFTISTNGNVINVIARASNKILEKEAVRVVSKLPQMQPGRQGKKNVAVQYTIPITFKVD